MAIFFEEDGTMKIIQGDTGSFTIGGIKTDKNYFVYFAIRDRNQRPVGHELMVESKKQASIDFYMDAELSDLLRVPVGHNFERYTYGLKFCDVDSLEEETAVISSSATFGKPCRLIVYPKQVEGIGR